MLLLERMVLGDSTGLGKTLQSIATYTWLLEKDPTIRILIVTNKSAIYQWQEEFEKFTIGITTRVITNEYEGLKGYNARKLQYENFKENVMILGYSTIKDEYESVCQALGNNFIVFFDECTAFKNRKTEAHFSSSFISERAKRVYGLSATIIKNGLEEVYGIYSVIVPGLFGRITKFKDTYCQQKMMRLIIKGKKRQIPKIVGYKNLDQFKRVLDPYFLIRKKEEVASELPKLISKKIVLEMYPEQKALYKQALAGIIYEEKVKREFYEISDKVRLGEADEKTMKLYEERKEKYEKFMTSEGKKRGKLAALTYCQMISNGPGLINQPGESSKQDEFLRLIKEELVNEKIILFTRFKTSIQFLEVICERNKVNYVKITGDDNDIERQKARQRFQTSTDCNLIFITQAGSASLNLQSAGCIIFYDTPWSYGDLVQTIGRAQRIGSIKEHILLLHLANKGTIDMRVLDKVTDKKDLSDKILGNTSVGALDFTSTEDSIIDELYEEVLKDSENG
jgi:SNF2 family DNA or RNA helicase